MSKAEEIKLEIEEIKMGFEVKRDNALIEKAIQNTKIEMCNIFISKLINLADIIVESEGENDG